MRPLGSLVETDMGVSVREIAGIADRLFHGEKRRILDPARARTLADIPDATGAEVDRAVERAGQAFRSGVWSDLDAAERGSALIRAAGAIRAHAEELALLDSLNVGKPIAQAVGEPEVAAQFFESCGRIVSGMRDEIVQATARQMTLVVREPLGVAAAIVPWNYPLAVAAASITGPLAAGNTVVLKPSPETPLSALRMAELLDGILPEGVLQVVTGGAETGRRLVGQRAVRKVNFTGSTSAGAEIMRSAAGSFKRVGLELGGKSPTVVFADAPFDAAVESAVWRFTANQGENCAAGSRLLVEESRYDEFMAALLVAARTLAVGDPQDERTQLGPMISERHRERVRAYTAMADHDAVELFVGSVPDEPPLRDGFYVPVSIFETARGAALWREEVFGPVLSVTRFRDEAHAAELANDTAYGLMAHIWCGDRGRALRFARRLDAGIIRVNRGVEPIDGPWGGFKSSGLGRNYGRYGIEASTELKQICLDIGDDSEG
jgi:acyl-CoA reductase-like NAD-dependent aldehyde dehydrogenase